MNEIITSENKDILTEADFREMIMEVQEEVEALDEALTGDALEKHCPIKNSFGDGIYVREMFCPKNTFVVTKLHKITHPYFVLKGDVSVLTAEGSKRIKAPFHGMTQAGTKRICFCHEDTVWITVHLNPTNTQNIDEIEKEVIAESYEAFDEYQKERQCSLES